MTRPAAQALRISGVVRADLRLSFSKPAANVTVLLVDRAPDGKTSIVTRGWTDPQNRQSPSRTKPIQPGKAYDIQVDLVPDDYVLAAGHSLAVVVMSSDYDYTLRPRPGAGISLDLSHSYLTLPAVGGQAAVRASVG